MVITFVTIRSHLLLPHRVPLPLQRDAPRVILAINTLAIPHAQHSSEETLAVFFEAEGFLAVAAGGFCHGVAFLGFRYFVGEGGGVSAEGAFDGCDAGGFKLF